MGISFQFLIENSLMIDFIYPYPPGSMNDPVLFPQYADMSNSSSIISEKRKITW